MECVVKLIQVGWVVEGVKNSTEVPHVEKMTHIKSTINPLVALDGVEKE